MPLTALVAVLVVVTVAVAVVAARYVAISRRRLRAALAPLAGGEPDAPIEVLVAHHDTLGHGRQRLGQAGQQGR